MQALSFMKREVWRQRKDDVTEDGFVMTEAEIVVKHISHRMSGVPAAAGSRKKEGFSPTCFRGSMVLPTP